MKYKIWSEGWRATGNNEPARLLDEIEAGTFDSAVEKYLKKNPSEIKLYFYDGNYHSIWGCRLFDNEKDARKFNG